jgi:Lrp/AsnC family transcriptional regulator for asnA, asnC and gidA
LPDGAVDLLAVLEGGPVDRIRSSSPSSTTESVGKAVPVSERTGVVLDDVSRAIIEQLQQDGRRPYARIAAAVGLSEAAVRQRVQRLLDAGIVQIVGVTDPMQVGFARQAMVGIRTRGDTRKVADAFAAFDEVDYVVVTAGSFDVLVEIVCEDDDRLLETVSRLRDVPGVESTETFVYLGLRKQTYTWGTRRPQPPTDAEL